MDPTNNISFLMSLPVEILVYIFSYLPPESLGNILRTSRICNQVGADNVLWKRHIPVSYLNQKPKRSDYCSLFREYQSGARKNIQIYYLLLSKYNNTEGNPYNIFQSIYEKGFEESGFSYRLYNQIENLHLTNNAYIRKDSNPPKHLVLEIHMSEFQAMKIKDNNDKVAQAMLTNGIKFGEIYLYSNKQQYVWLKHSIVFEDGRFTRRVLEADKQKRCQIM